MPELYTFFYFGEDRSCDIYYARGCYYFYFMTEEYKIDVSVKYRDYANKYSDIKEYKYEDILETAERYHLTPMSRNEYNSMFVQNSDQIFKNEDLTQCENAGEGYKYVLCGDNVLYCYENGILDSISILTDYAYITIRCYDFLNYSKNCFSEMFAENKSWVANFGHISKVCMAAAEAGKFTSKDAKTEIK